MSVFALGLLILGTGQEIEFSPEPGSAVRKTWVSTHDLRAEQMIMAIGDVRKPQRAPMHLTSSQTRTFVDEYGPIEDGRPVSLRRRFEELRQEASMNLIGSGQRPKVVRQSCELEGASVFYQPGGESGEYGRCYDAAEREEHLLMGLWEDTGLRALLPEGTVEIGAQWSLDPALAATILAPLGDVQWNQDVRADVMIMRSLRGGVGGGLYHAFSGPGSGDLEVQFTEVRNEEGRSLAVLKVTTDLRLSGDLTSFVRANLTPMERASGIEYKQAFMVLEIDGSGELLWDLEAGHVHAFDFEARERVSSRIRNHTRIDPDDVDREQEITLGGTFKAKLTTEPASVEPAPGPAK